MKQCIGLNKKNTEEETKDIVVTMRTFWDKFTETCEIPADVKGEDLVGFVNDHYVDIFGFENHNYYYTIDDLSTGCQYESNGDNPDRRCKNKNLGDSDNLEL